MIEALVPYSDEDSATCSSSSKDLQHGPADGLGHVASAAGDTASVEHNRPAKRARHDHADDESESALTSSGSKLQGLRNFPHQEGNFATTVFIPVRFSDAQRAVIQKTYDQLQDHAPMLHIAAWAGTGSEEQQEAVPAEQHISVSRTVALRYPQIEEVLGSLRQRLRKLSSFGVDFEELAVLANDNLSRVFACLMMGDGLKETCGIVRAVDKTFRTNGLRTFHEVPRPHVSVGWALADSRSLVEAAVASVNTQTAQQPEPPSLTATVQSVCCQIGQKRYTVWSAP